MANPDANRARPGAGGSRAPTEHVTAVDASTGTLTARAFAAPNPPRFRAARTGAAGDTSVAVRTTASFPASAATTGCSDWLFNVRISVGSTTDKPRSRAPGSQP